MVIGDLYLMSGGVFPAENDAPLVVNTDTPKAEKLA